MSEWQPIDTAPRDGSFIDAYDAHNGDRFVSRWIKHPPEMAEAVGREGQWLGFTYQFSDGPTNWMPLPPPPVERAWPPNRKPPPLPNWR